MAFNAVLVPILPDEVVRIIIWPKITTMQPSTKRVEVNANEEFEFNFADFFVVCWGVHQGQRGIRRVGNDQWVVGLAR